MPTSTARIAANQKNAQKSTGPTTEDGKNRARLNAFRHGLAGVGDVVMPGEDAALIARRTKAFINEVGAPGEVGELLAHRAAVLSVRMENAAERESKAVAEAILAGRGRFDEGRAEQLDAWVVEAEETRAPDHALLKLESCPEGLRYLRGAWRIIRAQVANGDEAALDRAAHWLCVNQSEEDSPATLLPGIEAEIARLDWLVDSPIIADETKLICTRRDDAGQIASFDPGPEATLARRYEAAAERGMYRAIREIRELRREQVTSPVVTKPSVPTFLPNSPPSPTAPLGSFRAATLDLSAGRGEPSLDLPTPPKNRPDHRKLVANPR